MGGLIQWPFYHYSPITKPGLYKVTLEHIHPDWGTQVMVGMIFPLLHTFHLNTGIQAGISSLNHILDTNLKFPNANNNGQFTGDATLQSDLFFIEIGVPVSLEYRFGSSGLGISCSVTYRLPSSPEYDAYNSVTQLDKLNPNNPKSTWINVYTGLIFENKPFKSGELSRLGWGVNAMYGHTQTSMPITLTPVKRAYVMIFLSYSLK